MGTLKEYSVNHGWRITSYNTWGLNMKNECLFCEESAMKSQVYSSSGLSSADQVTNVTNNVNFSSENTSSDTPDVYLIIEKKKRT